MNGVMIISPEDAILKAEEMKKVAGEIEGLLNNVSTKINEIDDVEAGVYQGRKNPAQLRAELDNFRDTFNLAYEQIIKSADDIIVVARTSENH